MSNTRIPKTLLPLPRVPPSQNWIDWNLFKGSLIQIKNGFLVIMPYIILVFLVVYFIYYILSYYYDLKRRYNCLSIKNLFNGQIFQCFNDPPEYCKDINPNLYWGWCLDADYYGAYPGDVYGPYGIPCNRWINKPNKCPPIQCSGSYPKGILVDSQNGKIQEYGWCADPLINRAMIGNYCGPTQEQLTCQNWIWDEAKCPQTCPIKVTNPPICPINQPPVTPPNQCPPKVTTNQCPQKVTNQCPSLKPQFQVTNKKCSLVCGIKNGKNLPCPPPDCQNECENECQCSSTTAMTAITAS
jgi:hypothetical protein